MWNTGIPSICVQGSGFTGELGGLAAPGRVREVTLMINPLAGVCWAVLSCLTGWSWDGQEQPWVNLVVGRACLCPCQIPGSQESAGRDFSSVILLV